jgi:Beta/Gamma crystallin
MKRIHSCSFATIFVLILLFIHSNIGYAAENDCWVDFFEESQYAGERLHLDGPAKLESLTKVNGENWEKRIHSLKVGPKAKVTVYQNPRFELTVTEMAKKPDFLRAWGITAQDVKEDSELIFNENAKIHDLGDFNFHKKVRSLKIDCL